MPMRITGMNSGLNTEEIVSAMVSTYQAKVTKAQKAQTSLIYKRDALKSVNTDVYSLFSATDKLRWSSAYSLKTTTVSDSTKAKVTAGNTAVNGTQTLRIKELAQAGYLTGGTVKGKDGATLSGSSKLSDVMSTDGDTFKGGSITLKDGKGKETKIELKDDMTVNEFVGKLKDAGYNASFDESHGRFFISAKASGAANDFTLSANNQDGMASLRALGLFTPDEGSVKEYQKWSAYTQDELNAMRDAQYKAAEVSYDSRAKFYVDQYNAASKSLAATTEALDKLNEKYGNRKTYEDKLAELKIKLADFDTKADAKPKYVLDEDGNPTSEIEKDKYGYPVYEFDTSGLTDEEKAEFDKLQSEIKDQQKVLDEYIKNAENMDIHQKNIDKYKEYVTLEDDGDGNLVAKADPANQKLIDEVDKENKDKFDSIESAINNRASESKEMLKTLVDADGKIIGTGSSGAVRLEGTDAVIVLNGAEFTSDKNTFSINGLSIEATAKTEGEITITTATDTQGLYDKIKDFIGQYNDVINKITKMYNAESAKGYEPLTDDEKAAMSDTEIQKWESKIKDSVLRRDETLQTIINAMKNAMSKVFNIDGKSYSLSSFGISTMSYFAAEKNQQNAYHIDGDSDDSAVSGNSDKLMAAITANPEEVAKFFQELSSSLYDSLNDKMRRTTLRSAYTIYNDKEMASEYSDYTKTISKWQDKVAAMEDSYYKKFAAMEKALASLNSQTSSLQSYFG